MLYLRRTSLLVLSLLAVACSTGKPEAVATSPSAVSAADSGASIAADSGSAGSGSIAAAADSGSADDVAAVPTAAAPGEPVGDNYLGLASGAYLVTQPTSDRAFDERPINVIIDGQIWRSDEGKVTDQVFVIETPATTTLTTIGFDTHHIFHTPEESAQAVTVEASNTSATDGYQPILAVSLDKEPAIASFPVTAAVPARWFRLTIKTNHGSTSVAALKRIFGYGTQETPATPTALTGTYRVIDPATGTVATSDDGDLFLEQDGTALVGCWRGTGTLSGGLEGTIAPLEWTHPDLGKQGGLLIASRGGQIVVWRQNAGSFWALDTLAKVSGDLGTCGDGGSLGESGLAKNLGETGLAKDLADKGRAVVYGINFDFNSDRLRDASKAILDQIVAILVAHPDWKMRIEGHTDSIGGAAFNQGLSERRAAAVVAYLTRANIDPARLSSSGAGLASPIDSNATELGRARNRRVELVKP